MTTKTIDPPADARRVFPWEFDGTGGWSRWFDGAARTAGPANVTLTGRQFDTGLVLRGVAVQLDATELLDPDETRSLAAALLVTAGELDRLRQ